MMRESGLSAAELDQFRRDGYLVVPDLVSRDTCASLVERARNLVDALDPSVVSIFSTQEQTRTSDDHFLGSGDKVRFFFEEEAFLPDGSLRQAKADSINKIGHALHSQDPVFEPFSTQRSFLAIISSLGQKKPALVQSMYIFKNPHIGGDVACHQDATFLYTEPTSVLGLWFALEDATLDNGCLWALPGGHHEPLRKRFVRNSGGSGTSFLPLDPQPLPPVTTAAPWVPLEAKAGTLVVLHGLLPHFSCANRSPRSRHAYSLHYVDDACRYPTDNWLQRN